METWEHGHVWPRRHGDMAVSDGNGDGNTAMSDRYGDSPKVWNNFFVLRACIWRTPSSYYELGVRHIHARSINYSPKWCCGRLSSIRLTLSLKMVSACWRMIVEHVVVIAVVPRVEVSSSGRTGCLSLSLWHGGLVLVSELVLVIDNRCLVITIDKK